MKKKFILKGMYTVMLVAGVFVASSGAFVLEDSAADTSTAKVKGYGEVLFQGDGEISVTDDVWIFVNENAEVDISGTSSYYSFENSEDGRRVYILEKGRVEISGQNIDVAFSGSSISPVITGKGRLTLKGHGIFRVGLTLGIWTPEGNTILLGN